MNKKTVLIASTLLVAGASALAFTYYNHLLQDLYKRFPDLDRKVIRKAYKQFIKDAGDQVHGDMENFDDEKMDALFLEIVRKQTASQ